MTGKLRTGSVNPNRGIGSVTSIGGNMDAPKFNFQTPAGWAMFWWALSIFLIIIVLWMM